MILQSLWVVYTTQVFVKRIPPARVEVQKALAIHRKKEPSNIQNATAKKHYEN